MLVVLADNGASQEGGPFGVMHEMKFFNGILETPDEAIAKIDDIGGPHSHTNYPWGWAQCGNSPFKWYKQNTHEGGVHVPMIVHAPGRIAADQAGSKRDQFVNVADIAPTIYDLVGVTPPESYRGVEQLPVTGHSFAGALDDPDAPAANTLQYFEMAGSRALVAGDGVAVEGGLQAHPGRRLRHRAVGAVPPHRRLVGVQRSGRQRARQARRADRPVVAGGRTARSAADRRPDGRAVRRPLPAELAAPRDRRYVYRPPMSPMPGQASAAIGGRAFDLTATVTRDAGDDGVLFATGTENSGISVFVQNDRLVVDYNAFDDHTMLESEIAVPAGRSTLVASFRRGDGMAGAMSVEVDGRPAGSADLSAVHADDVVGRAERRLRPRLTGVAPLRGAVPVRRMSPRCRRSNSCRGRSSTRSPPKRAPR